MYYTKYLELGSGETGSVKMSLPYAAENLAVWVKPGDASGTAMSYSVSVLYSGEEQVRWENTEAKVDIFRDTLLPGKDPSSESRFFPLDIEVVITNNSPLRRVFYVAFVAKSLAGERG